jgi:hypothetical protein
MAEVIAKVSGLAISRQMFSYFSDLHKTTLFNSGHLIFFHTGKFVTVARVLQYLNLNNKTLVKCRPLSAHIAPEYAGRLQETLMGVRGCLPHFLGTDEMILIGISLVLFQTQITA